MKVYQIVEKQGNKESSTLLLSLMKKNEQSCHLPPTAPPQPDYGLIMMTPLFDI